ncbi:MAG TPA: capsule assembly Wzi family protein, partial [Holophaga sp.]|nr:capsule assembly Wzi family protein [Holophaga sp.]
MGPRVLCLAGLLAPGLIAQGVSAYLPLQDAELNAQLDALAVVGDLPTLRKPYSVQAVKAALAAIRERHPDLHRELTEALRRYEQRAGLTRVEATLAASGGAGDGAVIPNGGGERMDSAYRVEATGQARLGDHLLLVAGGRATDQPGKVTPAGSHLALGWKHLQVDVGYRDRWISPMQDSAMVLSTQAEPPLSVGVSSPMPLPQFWNLHYEVFLSRLGPLQRVQEAGEVHWGRPYLLGTHLSLEPVRGWTVSATRMVQFGGDGQRVTPGRLWQA